MNEDRYRLFVVLLLAIWVFGSLYLGTQFVDHGRYVQYDWGKDYLDPADNFHGETVVIDTRNGTKHNARKIPLK